MTETQRLSPASGFLDRASLFFATGCYFSLLPSFVFHSFDRFRKNSTLTKNKWTGAGLFGSFEGALTYLLLPSNIASSLWAPILGLVFAVLIGGRAERALNSHDDSRIVIDEWIGTWIAMWGLSHSVTPVFIGAFVLFRIFDVLKGPVGHYLQSFPGGWGVTLDDVYAGLFANIVWRAAAHLLHLPY